MVLGLFKNFYKDKIVFITGNTGFQGAWLTLWLKLMGAKIIGYALPPPTNPSLFEVLNLNDEITYIEGNIRNSKKIQNSIDEFKPHIIFHLAAQSLVRQSYQKPVETFETNVMGTVNLLESICNVKSVSSCVIMTSDKCYANNENGHPFNEDEPLGGFDPYSSSKAAAELVTNAYRNLIFSKKNDERRIGVATARVGNVIGGGDWAIDRIIPDCINNLITKKKISIRNPNSIRPWQFVLEPLAGILWLAVNLSHEPTKFSQAWNFGPDDFNKTSVKELVQLIIKEWNYGEWIDDSNEDEQMHESNTLILDSKKALKILGWKTIFNLNETIRETTGWYKSLYNKVEMKEFSIAQISNYIEKAKQLNISWSQN